jgi:tetratricopeptide (TPR) repeat protein
MDKTIYACFESAQNIIKDYDEARLEAESVYAMANKFWQCYKVLLIRDADFSEADYTTAIKTLQFVTKKIGKRAVDFMLIPRHLKEYVFEKAATMKTNSGDFLQMCSLLVSRPETENNILSNVLQKLYLTVVLAILHNLAGNDIFSLINKCLVYDHMGNQAYSHSEFIGLLKKATEKASTVTFDSKKKLDVYFYLGMLNYRLNYYHEALKLLQKYAECLIIEKNAIGIDVTTKQKLARVFISLAYCFEKINDAGSINKAISILEAIKENKPIDVFDTSKKVSWIHGKTADYPNGQCLVSYESCDRYIQMEVCHALAHFYNERAVFHPKAAPTSVEEDIRMAREYISVAESMDAEHSLHSCHGLICFEDNDCYRASEIYDEALLIDAVSSNVALKNELLFYLAQSKSASGEIDDADDAWKKFEEFCRSTNNEDAMAQYNIIKTKSKLSGSKLYVQTLDEFKEMLDVLLSHRLSKYVPKSVADERERIILALNTFYALRSIIDEKSSFVDGIEEAFYNLGKYLENIRNKNTYSNFRFETKWLFSAKDGDGGRNYRTVSEDELFIIEYRGLRIACFGDYRNLMDSIYNVSFRGRLKPSCETEIVRQIKSNQHVDVIILTPTKGLNTNAKRKAVLKEIVTSGVCVIAYENGAEVIAQEVKGKGVNASPIYLAKDKNETLQMAFCLGIYELMRKNLIAPIPMLGLAPLIESKSYSFQAGERMSDLLIPPSVLTRTEYQQKNILCDIVTKLDTIQQNAQDKSRYPIMHGTVLAHYLTLLNGRDDISLVAFFSEQTEDASLHTSPYQVLRGSLKEAISYICPGKVGKQYDLTSIFKNNKGFDDAGDCIQTARSLSTFCNEEGCSALGCKSFCVGLKEESEYATHVTKLLQNIFSILEIKKNIHCVCTYVQYRHTSGILLIATEHLVPQAEGLHEICKIVHGYMAVPVSPPIDTPSIIKEEPDMAINTTKDTMFKIGVSFCGEHRTSTVEPVLTELLSHGYNKNDIFYDDWHTHLISTPGQADKEAKEIYEHHCDFIVVFLSKEYDTKPWTGGIEWEVIRRIINAKTKANRICLLNVDGVDINTVSGLSSLTSVAKKISGLSPSKIVNYISVVREKDCTLGGL